MDPEGVTQEAAKAYDRIAREYDARYGGPRWEVYGHVTERTVEPYLPPAGARVLDAGAGTGKWAVRLLANRFRVTLLDPSAEMLEVARRKIASEVKDAKAEYVVGSIEDLRFADGTFDFVFCEGDPLSYCLRTYEKAARELVRVLKPGAAFYVSCDSRWLQALGFLYQDRLDLARACADDGKGKDPYGADTHAFSPRELVELFTKAGARDVRVTGKGHLFLFFPDDRLTTLFADAETRRWWFDAEARLGADPSAAAFGGHLQVVGRKA